MALKFLLSFLLSCAGLLIFHGVGQSNGANDKYLKVLDVGSGLSLMGAFISGFWLIWEKL